MTDNHIDVLINGCGIGGAMLAYLLGRQGHRVVVVEQARRERARSTAPTCSAGRHPGGRGGRVVGRGDPSRWAGPP